MAGGGWMGQGGLASLLKEGHKVFEEPVLKNIAACKELATITRTSLGPEGLSKLVVNHLGKVFVTHDASTILAELEVQHPAARVLVLAAKSMSEEFGDGANSVLVLAGELLSQAEFLLRRGLHCSDVIVGYEAGLAAAVAALPALTLPGGVDVRNPEAVARVLRTVIGAKHAAFAPHLAGLVADACINAVPKVAANFNVDNVRVEKVEGMGISQSSVLHGFAIARDTEGSIKATTGRTKVAVFSCNVDAPGCETKGTVLVESAEALKKVATSEEDWLDAMAKTLSDAGVGVVVSGGGFGDLATHYLDRRGIAAVKIISKHQLRRVAAAVNATPIAVMRAPTTEELGSVDSMAVEEVGGRKLVVFRQEVEKSRLSTVLLRGATPTLLEDVERAVDCAINAYRALCRDPRVVAGGGAALASLSHAVGKVGDATPGVEQHAVQAFSTALLAIPRTLAEVAGHDGTRSVSALTAAVAAAAAATPAAAPTAGIDLATGKVVDMAAAGVVDVAIVTEWAIRRATEAAVNVLRVDQIIMAKPAGGPAAASGGGSKIARDDDE